jgi:DNA (cytosine-5)-methyltransferase 1
VARRRKTRWFCTRQSKGVKCNTWNPIRAQKCHVCGKPKPAVKKPKHMAALNESYEHYIHASPPCQAHSDLQRQSKREYEDFIPRVRDLLLQWGGPYVIENVEGAPLENPIVLCGTMFPGLRVIRHRLFETNFPIEAPPAHPKHPLVFTHDKRKAHYGKLNQDESFVQVTGGGNATIANKAAAMGIDWMTGRELNEAIPPAYTEWIGGQLMRCLKPSMEAVA